MNTAATRARTLLALGALTASSAALWGVTIFDHILSARADWTDGLAASTLSVVTALAVCNARSCAQRERMRVLMDRDRDIISLVLADRFSPQHGGDGDQAPQRPAWVLYQEPAA